MYGTYRTGGPVGFIAAANRNNPLLNYLHQKQANIWLEQATQIKASMGVSREKKDVDDQSRSIRKKLDFMLIKTVRMSSYGYPNAL